MIEVSIPPRGTLRLSHLVLDVNGTLALDGRLLPGVEDRLAALSDSLTVWLVSADTHGTLADLAALLNVRMQRLEAGGEVAQKTAKVDALGAQNVAAIGNGANDAGMLKQAALGIAVLGPEGLAPASLAAADLLVPNITTALDLLLHPRRLLATLRS